MTEDELDLLASAYLDGEATSEEVALVERDPELQARVEELRAVAEQLSVTAPPSAQLKEQHLAAALAAFSVDGDGAADGAPNDVSNDVDATHVMADTGGPDTEVMTPAVVDVSDREASADVIDLTGRSRKPKRHTGPGVTEKPSRSIPSWLPAAAALLVLGGGGAWLLSQASQDDSDTESAADFAEESAEEDTDGESADTQALRVDQAGDAESEAAEAAAEAPAADSDAADEAMEDDAMEEEEAMEDEDDSAEEDAESDTEQSSPSNETGEGGFFPEDPVLFFDSPPTVEEALDRIAVGAEETREDLSLSACAEILPELSELEPVAYLPIEVAGEPAELFVLLNEDGSETTIIVDGSCSQLTP